MNRDTVKSARDALVAGGPVAVVMVAMERMGFTTMGAATIAPIAILFATRAYRMLRARWPWLAELDS